MGSTTRKTEMAIIAGSLQGLTGYLVHFTQSAAEGVSLMLPWQLCNNSLLGAEYAKDIYLYTRKSINPEVSIYFINMLLLHVAIDTVDKI